MNLKRKENKMGRQCGTHGEEGKLVLGFDDDT
jgi:hypothetical protein